MLGTSQLFFSTIASVLWHYGTLVFVLCVVEMELAEVVDPEMMIKIKRDKNKLIREVYELCFLSRESVTILRCKGNKVTVEGTNESGNISMRGKAIMRLFQWGKCCMSSLARQMTLMLLILFQKSTHR